MSQSYFHLPIFLSKDIRCLLLESMKHIFSRCKIKSVKYETIDISLTSQFPYEQERNYCQELQNVYNKQGLFICYPTKLEQSIVRVKDILFVGNTIFSISSPIKYKHTEKTFYVNDNDGFIPELVEEKDFEFACRYFNINAFSFLCMSIEADSDKDVKEAIVDLYCELYFYRSCDNNDVIFL